MMVLLGVSSRSSSSQERSSHLDVSGRWAARASLQLFSSSLALGRLGLASVTAACLVPGLPQVIPVLGAAKLEEVLSSSKEDAPHCDYMTTPTPFARRSLFGRKRSKKRMELIINPNAFRCQPLCTLYQGLPVRYRGTVRATADGPTIIVRCWQQPYLRNSLTWYGCRR